MWSFPISEHKHERPFPFLFYWWFSPSPLKGWEVCQRHLQSRSASFHIFPNICSMKGNKSLQCPRAGGRCGIGCPDAALQRPFLCRQAARRLPHLSLHIPASFCCSQLLSKPPGRGLERNKRSWVCGGRVETLIFLSQQRQTHVTGDPSTLGTVAESSL